MRDEVAAAAVAAPLPVSRYRLLLPLHLPLLLTNFWLTDRRKEVSETDRLGCWMRHSDSVRRGNIMWVTARKRGRERERENKATDGARGEGRNGADRYVPFWSRRWRKTL